jgi:hypothetical protein
MKKFIIYILLLNLVSCKVKSENNNLKNNSCFEKENKNVYLNYINNTKKTVLIPNISTIINSDLSLNTNFYKIKNDTLYIRLLENNDFIFSDKTPNMKINVRNNYVKVETDKKRQQFFVITENFSHILIDNKDYYYNCSK